MHDATLSAISMRLIKYISLHFTIIYVYIEILCTCDSSSNEIQFLSYPLKKKCVYKIYIWAIIVCKIVTYLIYGNIYFQICFNFVFILQIQYKINFLN